jgi:glutamate-1-semialdehyde 2,1-aminomutase
MISETTQNLDIADAVKYARDRYAARNPESQLQHESRKRVIPSGNPRDSVAMQPFPLTLSRGEGSRIWDVDGHEYLDCMADFTTGLYGYRHASIDAAIERVLTDGSVRGGPNPYQAPFAEQLVARYPSLELVRFSNSGTEANLMVIATAAAYSGRDRILTFHGSFFGAVMDYCATEAAQPLNLPIPLTMATFNDIDGTVETIRREAGRLAAVMLEPMMVGAGCIPADGAFLQAVRQVCDENNLLLIFDEIVTSRLAFGGLQEYYGVTPDLTTLGKHLGGGMPFGAFGGRREIMEHFDPMRPGGYTHHGTFNGNLFTMAAGLAGMEKAFTPEAARNVNARGEKLKNAILGLIESRDLPMQVTGIGSLMMIHFHDRPINSPADVEGGKSASASSGKGALLRLDMLERGFYFGSGGFIGLSLPFSDHDADCLVDALDRFMTEHAALLGRIGVKN